MRRLSTDILVIGGGATGTGILRDLAMRGFKAILVEKRDLAYGTTGRFHGLLHSGARYVVKDPSSAVECYKENLILRQIMPQCIEDTGGYFVRTRYDDPSYTSLFIEGCHNAGIPVEEVTIKKMLKEEPLLDPKIQQCFRVPDGSADSYLGCDLNAESARSYGAQIFPYHEVLRLVTVQAEGGSKVTGAICLDLVRDEEVQIDSDLVINASGAWAGIIAKMAGIDLRMLPGKGTMVALNHRVVNTVINRCKMPSDGDILVPAHTVAVMGTTDIRVSDPDSYAIEPWEIRLMLDEGEKIIPRFKELRILRAWSGVRPLIQETETEINRDVTRGYSLIVHSARDHVDGFLTITGGKWTTYRKMAEVTVDKACEILGVTQSCRTHLEPLPHKNEPKSSRPYPGARLERVEHNLKYGHLICECELATSDDVENAIVLSNAVTLDDIRRDVRLGMGPCQGAFCTFRAAGLLHDLRHPPVKDTNTSMHDFLQERWKGNLPVMWGQQLRQERLNELIYISTLNINALPYDPGSPVSSRDYLPAKEISARLTKPVQAHKEIHAKFRQQADVVVIGAGLSGLIAGWRACLDGYKTHVISKGWGATYWGSGCIDLLGYAPPTFDKLIDSPGQIIDEFIESNPMHPYALIGVDLIQQSIHEFLELTQDLGYPYAGSPKENFLLPTALGSMRPTCLAPKTMLAGDGRQNSPMLIVGFSHFLDFFPSLAAENLSAQGIPARAINLDLASLQNIRFLSSSVLARLFDQPEFRQDVINAVKPWIKNAARIGFPAVLGLQNSMQVMDELQDSFGVPVFEMPGLPPSIPGIRLHRMLVSAIERLGGLVDNGMSVTSAVLEENKITAVNSSGAARQISHIAEHFILATGGILGGGISTKENGDVHENILGLPVGFEKPRSEWFGYQFLEGPGHPIHTSGLHVDAELHPLDGEGQVIFDNLVAIGGLLGHCDPIREHSLEGIALASGYKSGVIISRRGH